jgi:hypothetical protein
MMATAAKVEHTVILDPPGLQLLEMYRCAVKMNEEHGWKIVEDVSYFGETIVELMPCLGAVPSILTTGRFPGLVHAVAFCAALRHKEPYPGLLTTFGSDAIEVPFLGTKWTNNKGVTQICYVSTAGKRPDIFYCTDSAALSRDGEVKIYLPRLALRG